MTLFGLAAIIAPIVGPTLGGCLCVDYDWRWIFLVNVPIGLLALAGAYAVVGDPGPGVEVSIAEPAGWLLMLPSSTRSHRC